MTALRSCARTDDPADIALDVRELGAAYLGGTRLGALAAAGLVTRAAAGHAGAPVRRHDLGPGPLVPADLLGSPVGNPEAPGLADTEVLHETGEMRITLSGAMRARDVSRPTDEQLAAAAEREARTAGSAGRAGSARRADSAVAGRRERTARAGGGALPNGPAGPVARR